MASAWRGSASEIRAPAEIAAEICGSGKGERIRIGASIPAERSAVASAAVATPSIDATVSTVHDLDVKPVVPVRDVPKNLDALPPEDRELTLEGASNIVRDKYTGKVACYDCSGSSPVRRETVYAGFDASRECHTFRCPLGAIGQRCEYYDRCHAGSNGESSRQVRVPMAVDPRRFGPIYSHSKHWKRIYRGRTAAERYNSYVKRVLRLDEHCLRGRSAIGLRALMCAITVNIRLLIRVQEERAAEAKAA